MSDSIRNPLIEQLVDEALEGLKNYFVSTPPNEVEDWEDNPKARYIGGELPIDHGKVARLRFDWELDGTAGVSVNDNDHISRLMCNALKWDLVDVIENGDISIVDDPLLKAMNGAKKLGKEPQKVIIEELVWFREEKPKKNAYEYTVFMLLSVEWED